MRIAIDVRPLLEPYLSGIGEYTYNVLKTIFEGDTKNQYHLFYNIRHSVKVEPLKFKYPNVKYFGYHYPNRWLNLSLRFLGWPRLEKLSGNPDVIWFPNFGFMNFNIKTPYVLTVHDLSFERYPDFFTPVHRLWHKLINCKKMAQSATKIIAVSENTKQDLVELYGVEPGRVEVIYESVEPLIYTNQYANLTNHEFDGNSNNTLINSNISNEILGKVKKKYNLPERFILFLGTIEPRKNIEAIIRAFDKVCDSSGSRDSSIKLILAGGPGWRNEQIYKVYERAKHKDKIKFIGYVDKEDKPALYGLASLFVFPSIYEGFGLPPLEAMACGTPVIVSNVSSLPEVVEDAGLLVDPYNICELAEAMKWMLEDEKLRTQFIERGFEQTKKFSWEKCGKEVRRVIEEVA